MAPVVRALAQSRVFDAQFCDSGQHPEMILPALNLFDIRPDYQMNVMQHRQSLSSMFAKLIAGIGDVLDRAQPRLVVVHGDTATTLAASLAAYFARIPVAHIEAGLRTHNIYSPWPEEVNRKLAAGIVKWHFAPTERARQNLLAEGYAAENIQVVGNTVIDALMWVSHRLHQDRPAHAELEQRFSFLDPAKKLILVTGHRRESFGTGFDNICQAIREIARRSDVQVLYPVHLNPMVREPVHRVLGGLDNVFLIEPEDYMPFVYLIERSYLLLTDSGGLQEEAPALGKPVLVMRDTTERPEAIEAGTAKLVGTQINAIVSGVAALLDSEQEYQSMANATNPFGDGTAAEKIVRVLEEKFTQAKSAEADSPLTGS